MAAEKTNNERITLWVTPEVKAELKYQAQLMGVSASAYVSMIVMERKHFRAVEEMRRERTQMMLDLPEAERREVSADDQQYRRSQMIAMGIYPVDKSLW